MYSDSKVQARIAAAEREFSVRLTYRSIDEVDSFESHLRTAQRYVYSDLGLPNGTHSLTPDESAWMLNEQLLCMCDVVYFMTRYAYLRNEEGIVQRFRFRVPQRIYFDIICDLESRDASVEVMALKARQLGVSIFSELLLAHRIIFSYGTTGVIGSADQTKTADMSRMLFFAYDSLPVWLRPQYTARVESERGKLIFGSLASGVTFQHGTQKFGIGTGSTPTLYHLSEVALYGEAAVKLIDEGLWKAVHASPHVFGVLESTGRGNVGWWAKTWHYSKSNWPNCRMYPMFLPWFTGVDIYPMPADRRTHPIPLDWTPNRDTREHVAKSELFVASTALLKKHLLADQQRRGVAHGGTWRMPRDQAWYWEWNHEEAKAKGTESSFLQEMAGDDEEALQRSTESVFGHETIQLIDASRRRTYLTYGLSGQSIEDAHEPPPEDIDYRAERIPVRYSSRRGETYRWELIPLTFAIPLREGHPDDAIGKLFVYYPPRPGVSYSIGVDTSEGVGADSTVITVWAVGERGEQDIQVAEFASAYVNHVEAFAFALCVAAYYAQYMQDGYESGTVRWREPYVTIEQIAAVGDTAQHQMGRMGYNNFHHMTRYDASASKTAHTKRTSGKRGWFTSGWSRPILVSNFVHAAKNGWIEINSPWLLAEMAEFEVHETSTGKPKLEHSEDSHDDRIFAAAMAVFCPHDMDVLAERSKKRIVEPSTLPAISLAPITGGLTFTAAQLTETRVLTLDDVLDSAANGSRRI